MRSKDNIPLSPQFYPTSGIDTVPHIRAAYRRMQGNQRSARMGCLGMPAAPFDSTCCRQYDELGGRPFWTPEGGLSDVAPKHLRTKHHRTYQSFLPGFLLTSSWVKKFQRDRIDADVPLPGGISVGRCDRRGVVTLPSERARQSALWAGNAICSSLSGRLHGAAARRSPFSAIS